VSRLIAQLIFPSYHIVLYTENVPQPVEPDSTGFLHFAPVTFYTLSTGEGFTSSRGTRPLLP
jgi:hypothetical protein